jgi:hypothetical protein
MHMQIGKWGQTLKMHKNGDILIHPIFLKL